MQNYLFMLLENLRYVLQNLEPGNFNGQEMEAYFKKLAADLVVADVVISNTIITNELYASYGAIADLTVDKLRTDYKRAQKYLAGDLSPIDYISIHDERISFITATTDGSETEQLTVDGKAFWWTDETKTQMTREKDTGIAVTVYRYEELTKAEFRFHPIELEHGGSTMMPALSFGAGTGVDDKGTALLKKHETGLDFTYRPRTEEKLAGLYFRDDGFVDASHRRADVRVDAQKKTITIRPEGTLQQSFEIAYEEAGDTLSLTWPDGKTFQVVKSG